jgi:hypothetical protein
VTISLTTFSIMTLGIKKIICDTQHNDTQQNNTLPLG